MFIALTAAEECAIMCTMIYAPICATDGITTRTFSNACTMAVYNCQNTATTFRQLRSGVCDVDVSDGEVPDAEAFDIVF
ncbi:hypothetical protein Cfor_00849 [Coptotermes formosanus]|nr:hypothetical protein Cfor_00849 [Coptotermes formosanus]